MKPDFWQTPLEQLIAMRQVMIENDDEELRIWATEYGLPTNVVTEQEQADFIADFLDAWDDLKDENGVSYTGPAFIYSMIDRLTGSPNDQDNFGIFFDNWMEKLAAQVIRDFIEEDEEEEPPVDPGTAIGNALAQLFQQLAQQLVQQVAQQLAQAVANTLAQALANLFAGIFNPAVSPPPAALMMSAESQEAMAEGTMLAAEQLRSLPTEIELQN